MSDSVGTFIILTSVWMFICALMLVYLLSRVLALSQHVADITKLQKEARTDLIDFERRLSRMSLRMTKIDGSDLDMP